MEFLGQFLSTNILLMFHTACLNHCFFFLTILTKFPVSLVSLDQHLLQQPIACFCLFSLKVSYLVPNKLVHNTCLTLMSGIDINLYVCIHRQDKYCLLILVPIMLSFYNGSNFGEKVYFKLYAHQSMCATDFSKASRFFQVCILCTCDGFRQLDITYIVAVRPSGFLNYKINSESCT